MYEIDDITVFCRVVDLESFSAAGRDLRISTAVVSSRIHKLEQKLGSSFTPNHTVCPANRSRRALLQHLSVRTESICRLSK